MEVPNTPIRPSRTLIQIVWLALIAAAIHLYFFPGSLRGAARGVQASNVAELPGERHLRHVRQLTQGGSNAEAYWSPDGTKLIFQSTREGYKADQIYVMNADGSDPHMVSTGKGRCTCAYFMKKGERILYSSTHLDNPEPPPPPDRSHGYVWGVFPGYDIFTANPDGSDLRRLTSTPGYDAEATVSPDGERIVFTSMRDGDLDIYSMKADGSDVRRLTRRLGYDGGPYYSPDGKMICYRAYHPTKPDEVAEYSDLLKQNLVKPAKMEIYVMDADGSQKHQVTRNGAANFCPYFTPDGKRLIFASNMDDPERRNFDLYLVSLNGTGLERVTLAPAFDGFPMFSPDGTKLAWASGRGSRSPFEMNIFVADWVP